MLLAPLGAKDQDVSERNPLFKCNGGLQYQYRRLSQYLHEATPMDVRISRPYKSADLPRVGTLNSEAQQALLESILEEGKEIQRRKREQLGRHKAFWRQ